MERNRTLTATARHAEWRTQFVFSFIVGWCDLKYQLDNPILESNLVSISKNTNQSEVRVGFCLRIPLRCGEELGKVRSYVSPRSGLGGLEKCDGKGCTQGQESVLNADWRIWDVDSCFYNPGGWDNTKWQLWGTQRRLWVVLEVTERPLVWCLTRGRTCAVGSWRCPRRSQSGARTRPNWTTSRRSGSRPDCARRWRSATIAAPASPSRTASTRTARVHETVRSRGPILFPGDTHRWRRRRQRFPHNKHSSGPEMEEEVFDTEMKKIWSGV